MICVMCRQTEVVESSTTIHFQRGKIHLVITHVPAQVCQSCGDACVSEDTASQLLRIAKERVDAGGFEEELQYDKLMENE